MFNNLLESQAQKQKRLGGSVTSIVVHTAIVVALVIVTKNSGIINEKPKEEKVDFVEVKKVKVGDTVDGGRIAAITATAVEYQKGGRMVTLSLPTG